MAFHDPALSWVPNDRAVPLRPVFGISGQLQHHHAYTYNETFRGQQVPQILDLCTLATYPTRSFVKLVDMSLSPCPVSYLVGL